MAIAIPSTVISGTIVSEVGEGFWPYDDAQGDPWWSGGTTPRDYLWTLVITVTPQIHSSHLTRKPYTFNGFDIKVGDWIARNNTGRAAQIISISEKTDIGITVLVEDIGRYNTFRSPNSLGTGSLGVGTCMIFRLNEEGEPLIDPLPVAGISGEFYSNLMSRFQNFNVQYDYNLTQVGHTFELDDIISADASTQSFVLADSDNTVTVGKVSELGPTPDRFYINPVQKIIEDFNSLPGNITDILFVDDTIPGGLTTDPSSNKTMYVKLKDNTQSISVATNPSSTTTPGNVIEINGTAITIAGTGSIADAVIAINASALTGITADEAPAPTTVSTTLSLFYGEPALYATAPIATATINGVLVTFDISTVGQSTYAIDLALEEDLASAINRDMLAASNTDIVASSGSNILTLTNVTGGAITIVNGTGDQSGAFFAGVNSGTGLELITAATIGGYLRLTADDARAIDIYDLVGAPAGDYGIDSVENGKKAAALYIEKGLRTASSVVVADISARNALSPSIGDQAMVLDKGNGEWELYLWDGSVWIAIANEDSARTDANSVEYIVNFNTTALAEIVTVSNNSRITLITIEVVIPFDSNPVLTVGTSSGPASLFSDDLHDLSAIGTYASHTDTFYNDGIDTDILASYTANGATTGQAKIVVSYM